MRIDLPCCGFKNCRYQFDGNCTRKEKYQDCEYQNLIQERRTGKWLIRIFGGDAQCSECGMYFKDAYDLENSDHYCRHCGTKMEGTALKLNG